MFAYDDRRPDRRAQSPHIHPRSIAVLVGLLLCTVACSHPNPQPEPDPHPSHAEQDDRDEHTQHEEHDGHEEHEEGLVELSPEAAARARIRTAPVTERVLATQLSTTGHVDFDEDRLAHVSPRISGRVHRVHAVLGQEVRPGQVLAEIDSIELGHAKAAFLQAKAREELARTSFERTRSLLAEGIAPEQHVLEDEASLREATTALHTAEETLQLYGLSREQVDALSYDERGTSIHPLRAPFGGTVIERHVTLGELVTPERNLFTLADLDRVWIWIDVYQRDLGGVHLGDQAQARVDAFPDEVFEGTVSYLSARVDADTRTVRARLDVVNPGGKLRPGMFVDVELVDPHGPPGKGDRVPSRVVPESALIRDGSGRDGSSFRVFVALDDPPGEHRFERRDVRIGRRVNDLVEILDGLDVGESVVVDGAFLLQSAASRESLGGGHSH